MEVFYLFMIRGGLRFDTTSSFGMYPKGLFHFIDHPVPGLLLSIPYRCSFGKMYFSYLLSPSQRSSKAVFESPLSVSVIVSLAVHAIVVSVTKTLRALETNT